MMNCVFTFIFALTYYGLWGLVPITTKAFSLQAKTTTTSTNDGNFNSLFSSHFRHQQGKKDGLVLTYLEINGFLLSTSGVTILIDPILEGELDFGIPFLYRAKKKTLSSTGLIESLPPIDCILITQGLDDHAHIRTLKKISTLQNFHGIPIVAPPSAEQALEQSGFMETTNTVQFLRHGETTTVFPRQGEKGIDNDDDEEEEDIGISIYATIGALVGPPWQTRENGYILRPKKGPSIYLEPHVEFSPNQLVKERPVDIVITPIVGQGLPAFDLVHGPQDTIRLLEALRPKLVIPMPNGNVEANGIVSPLVQTIGTVSEFGQRLTQSSKVNATIMNLIPGQDHIIKI